MAMATPRTPRRPHLPAPSHNRVPRRRTSSARVGSSKGTTRVTQRRGFVQRLRETPGRTGLADCRYGQAKSATAGNSQSTEHAEGFPSTADATTNSSSSSSSSSASSSASSAAAAASAASAAREWLAERGHTPVADGILGAFQRASIDASQWPGMLAGMTSVELAALVGSVKRQNALAAAVQEQRDPRTTAAPADTHAVLTTCVDGVNSPATRSDTGDSDNGSTSSSSDDRSECGDDYSSSGDEDDSPADQCNKGRLQNAKRSSTAERSSLATQQSVPWRHAVGERVDLDALYNTLSVAEVRTGPDDRPAASCSQGVHHLESAWARQVARLFHLSWQLRQHKTCCGWITSTLQDRIRAAPEVAQGRQTFCDAMLATDAAAPTAAPQAEDRSIDEAVAADTLIARAQQRARNAAWGLNSDVRQRSMDTVEHVSRGTIDSLWTEVASGLLANSEQRDIGGAGIERHAVARRNAGLIALAETVQKVVVVHNGKRSKT